MSPRKGKWHQCPQHAKRAGKLGAKNSPWSKTMSAKLKRAKARASGKGA